VLDFAMAGKNQKIINMLIAHRAGKKASGKIAKVNPNLMVEARSYGFGLSFELAEQQGTSFFMNKSLAIESGLIDPTGLQFEAMRLRHDVGTRIEIIYYKTQGMHYLNVVNAKLLGQDGGRQAGKLSFHVERLGVISSKPLGMVLRANTKEGCRIAYADSKGGKWMVVLDGQPGPEYDEVGKLVFSPDSKRLAYVAARGNMWLVVVDGQSGPEYDGILQDNLIFSSDGKRLAYAVQKGNKRLVVVDGQSGPEYDAILQGSPVFSSDSKRLAYAVRMGTKSLVVVDGQPSSEYAACPCGPVFRQDGVLEFLAVDEDVLYRVTSR
jgi:hypothetical protein